jgi:pyruvate,water dikinase
MDIRNGDLHGIRDRIMSAPLPDAVAQAITAGYGAFVELAAGQVSLAVRSSATAEDSAALSFAGLHDTILSVRSLPVLEASIRQCWASLWSDRAVEYRRAGHLDVEDAGIAVIIQQLVRSDVSFVIFTSDPVTGSSEHLVISASWGLGEAVVSGLVTPDHIVVDQGGRVVSYRVGRKEQMVVSATPPAEGTRLVPVPRVLQNIPVMSHEQAGEMAAIARTLSSRLGYEADLEGGIADGKLYLFQARPITTLRPLPDMEPARLTKHLRS